MWVAIHPDSALFGTQTREQVKKAVAGIKVDVPVTADTKPAIAQVEALKTRMAALNDKLAKLRITADGKQAEATIAKTQAKLAALAKTVASITMKADTTKLDAQIAAEKAKLAAFTQQASEIKMDANTTAALAKIAALNLQASRLAKALKTMKGDLNIAAATTKLAAVQAELKVLRDAAEKIKLVADKKAIDAAITATEARIAVLQKQAADIKLGGNVDTAGLLAAEASLLGLEAAFGKAADESAAAKTAMDAFFSATGRGSTFAAAGWKLLTGHITLFGGALNQVLPRMFTSVAVWHLLADAVIELVAVWAPAIIAVTAFGVAGADAAKSIFQRMQAVHTVMDATGKAVPPLSNNFEKLAASVKPEVYQLFGDALVVMGKRGGAFNTVAIETGRVLDQLAARFVLAVTSGSGVNKFMSNAVTDVRLLGDSIGNLGGIFGAVFRAVPGYAEILLTVGDGITKVLEAATRAAEPVIAVGLALHGFFIYGGAAVTASLALVASLVKVGAAFGKFNEKITLVGLNNLKKFGSGLATAAANVGIYGSGLAGLARSEGAAAAGTRVLRDAQNLLTKVPTTVWVLAAAAALASLVIAIARSKDAAQQFNDTLQQTITNAPLASVVTTIQAAQAATAARLAASTGKLNEAIRTNTAVNAGRAGTLNSNGTAIQNLDNATRHYAQGQAQLDAQSQLVNTRIGLLSKAYGGNAQAIGLLNAAGITSTQITAKGAQAWDVIKVQVEATAKAYAAMGTQAGVLGNDLDVLGRTVTDQAQATKKLNDAWTQFIGDVTGTQGAFDTVAQGFETLATHSGDLKLSLGKLKTSFADAASGAALQGKVASATAAVASAQNSLNKLQKSGTGTALQLTAAHARLAGAQDRLTAAQKNLSAAQVQGKAAIDSLSPAGVALNQAFSDQVVNIDKLFASWRTAGLAGNLFTAGVKDAIAPLVKYATGSKEATAQLVALAQEAGYQGPISMQALTTWLGNTHDATQKLKDITNQATSQEALLTGAMQAQGTFIANKLLGDINAAALSYYDVEGAVRAYGAALAKSGKNSDYASQAMTKAVAALVKSGLAIGDNAQQLGAIVAKVFGIGMPTALKLVQKAMADMVAGLPPAQKKFELFAISGLSVTRAEADRLWKKFSESNLAALADKADTTRAKFDALASKGLALTRDQADQLWKHLRMQYLDTLGAKGDITRGKFIQLAQKGLDLTRTAAQNLWDTLHRQQLTDAANKAGETRTQFERLASQLGVTKGYADRLWASLHKVSAGSPYHVTIHESGTGLFTITGPGILKSQGVGGSGNAAGGLAAGGLIRMGSGPTADDVHAMVSRGEYVQRAAAVNQYGVQAMDAVNQGKAVIGYASGGLVRPSAPGGAALGSLSGQTIDFHNSFAKIMTNALGSAMTKALILARAAAIAAAAGGGTGSAGDIVSYARGFLGKIPYKFGGTTLQGMDCSGFTGMVYRHFGYKGIPRTSEGQGSWVHATPTPQAGGLAFYHSPAGGPDPGHVAIIDRGARGIISQGGGLGPKLEGLHALPLLWTGIPPGGFHVAPPAGGKSGGAPAQAQAWMKAHMGDYGWGGAQWPSLYNLWQGESGWRWNAQNPTSPAYGIPQCMDTHTKILTRRGWLSHDEVRPGDETIGYNPQARRSEWTLVTEVLHPGPAELWKFGVSRWSIRSTPNHRWLMERLASDKPVREEMVELRHHEGRKHRLVLARPAETSGSLDISVHEAALLGWIAGDGWQVKARPDIRRSMTYGGTQVRTKRWDYFENLLQGDPHLAITRERDTGGGPKAAQGYGVREWRMSAPYARDLTERAGGNPKEAAVEQVLRMSTGQRAAWLEAIENCDGYTGDGSPHHRYRQISQKEGPIADAVCLALYLSGKTPSVYKDERYENTVLTIGVTEPYIGLRTATAKSAGVTEVWCVRTDLGTWTAQQDGRIFLTGNSDPGSKMATVGADWRTNPVTQMRWGAEYIRGIYGNPSNAYSLWLGRHPHWYGGGGMVPGMAAGGPVTPAERAGQTWLNAWRSKRGGGFGAAWGPVVVNEQIAEMGAAISKAKTLSKAPGLTAAQHKSYAALASTDTRKLAVLNKELATERTWRGQLGSLDTRLASDITAAKGVPRLAGNVTAWKKDITANQYTIGQISKMLGYSNAQIAALEKAGKLGPGGAPIVQAAHTYGGDVGVFNAIAPVLAKALQPFARGGMAALGRGGMAVFDRGGTLAPGANMVWNGLGRDEKLVPEGSHVTVTLEVAPGGNTAFEQLLHTAIRKHVKVRGGGSVQRAYSTPGTVSGSNTWRSG